MENNSKNKPENKSENKSAKKFNSKMIFKIALADLLIFAAAINIFAYFDHVRGGDDDTPMQPIFPPSFDSSSEESTDITVSNGNDSSEDVSENISEEVSEDVSEEISEEVSEEVSAEEGFPKGTFTDGEIISTETVYKSQYVSVEVKEIYHNDKLYMIQDIYVKHIESLAVGFAKGLTPLSGEKQTIFQITQHYRNNGYNIIASINGDYCGYNSKGATIRNGVLYGKGIAQFDVCVVYKDGTMVTMPAKEFDKEAELAKGAWHVWDFGPTLLNDDGSAIPDFSHRNDIDGSNPRTAIGYYEPGHYCFVVAGGRGEQKYGVTLEELAQVMESLECKTAYNLDGGRSSIMIFGEKIINEKYQDVTRKNTDIVFIQDFAAN